MARLVPQSSTTPTIRQGAIPAIIVFAGWHWRRQWLLFLLMSLAMISLVFLACLLPSLTDVAPTAELHLRLNMARLPLVSITFQVSALLLFFLHLMAKVLVERQADTLAVLHNRGASPHQILGSLLLQSAGAGLIACLIGPPLAYLTAASLFPGRYLFYMLRALHTQQAFLHALHLLNAHTWFYAGGAVLLALVVIIATLYYALRQTLPGLDATTATHESEPPHRDQVKIEINIEVLVALIALTAYVLLLALFRPQDNTTPSQFPLLAPIAPTLLLAGLLPLCLRCITLLSMLGIQMMQPGYMTTPMLAALHTIRPPRQLARMALLLTLATTFTIFTLVFTASQERRISDIAASSIGADFSGTLPDPAPPALLSDVAAPYRSMRGTLSVTMGATAIGNDPSGATYQIQAVDASTFSRTASWPQQDTALPLSQMMQLLLDQRLMATQYHVVPAIIDDTTSQMLSVRPGMTFALRDHSRQTRTARYLAIASIPHIPGTNNGLLVDYQSLTNYQAKNGLAILPVNHVWLRTSDDQASLKFVRKIITTSLRLDDLLDRRFLLSSLQSDPLVLAGQSILVFGAITALVLAALGNILAFWNSTKPHRVNRALLHALETEPGQVASLVIWEQGSAFLMALLPGLLIGLLLSLTFIPILLTHLPLRSSASPDATWYTSQQLLPAHAIIPTSLGIILGLVLLLTPLILLLLVRMLSLPALNHNVHVTEHYHAS